jgi:hypothetical protein
MEKVKNNRTIKKPTKHPVSLIEFGPVRDISKGGYAVFSDNLKKVLMELDNRKRLFVNGQKVKVEVSDVYYSKTSEESEEIPLRKAVQKVYTVWYLLKLWKLENSSDFSSNQ